MVCTKIVHSVLKHLPGATASKAAELVSQDRWLDYISLTVNPDEYDSWYHYAVARQAVDLARKFPGLPGLDSDVRERNALIAFLEGERQNKRTNIHFLKLEADGPFGTEADYRLRNILLRGRSWLQRVLGDEPPRPNLRFSSGSVYEAKDLRTSYGLSVYDKISAQSHSVTQLFLDTFEQTLDPSAVWRHWFGSGVVNESESDKLLFVEKDAKTLRTIIPQSLAMLSVQLGYGEILSKRLSWLGMCKSTAQRRHKLLAAKSSWSKDHATIDLKNASNTLSRGLVKYLLPEGWYVKLDACRKRFVEYSNHENSALNEEFGGRYKLEMFSAMGNGYTFELETLIFSALCAAIGCKPGKDSWVFGDDIIVPESKVDDLYAILAYCGLTPNKSKSFSGTSPFRESCGGDYFNGRDVTPRRLTSEPTGPIHWIEIHNKLCDIERRLFVDLRKAKLLAINQLPSHIRSIRGPFGYPGVLWDDRADSWQIRGGATPRIRRVVPEPLDKTLTAAKYCETTLMLASLDGYLSVDEVPPTSPKDWDGETIIYGPTLGVTKWKPRMIQTRSMAQGYKVSWTPVKQSSWLPSGEPKRYVV